MQVSVKKKLKQFFLCSHTNTTVINNRQKNSITPKYEGASPHQQVAHQFCSGCQLGALQFNSDIYWKIVFNSIRSDYTDATGACHYAHLIFKNVL